MPYIADFDLQWRGWGFPAERCDEMDPDAVCQMDAAEQHHTEPRWWLKPADPDQWYAWVAAGQPRDEDSLHRYGAVKSAAVPDHA